MCGCHIILDTRIQKKSKEKEAFKLPGSAFSTCPPPLPSPLAPKQIISPPSSIHQGASVMGREVFGELRLEMITGHAQSSLNCPEATQTPHFT